MKFPVRETIFGYGSLMDQKSTIRTMPSAKNFRPARLFNYRRVFNLVSIGGIQRGEACLETNEVAALAISPALSSSSFVDGILFDIPQDELSGYFEREHRYKRIEVSARDMSVTIDSIGMEVFTRCWTVIEQSDIEYKSSLLGGAEEYHERVGKHYSGVLWGRPDILPMRNYLIEAIKAAKELGGDEWLHNFLHNSFLADRITTIQQYVTRHPEIFIEGELLLSNQSLYNESDGKSRL